MIGGEKMSQKEKDMNPNKLMAWDQDGKAIVALIKNK